MYRLFIVLFIFTLSYNLENSKNISYRKIASIEELPNSCMQTIRHFILESKSKVMINSEDKNKIQHAKSIDEVISILEDTEKKNDDIFYIISRLKNLKENQIPFVPIGKENIRIIKDSPYKIELIGKNGGKHYIDLNMPTKYYYKEEYIERVKNKLIDTLSLLPRSHYDKISSIQIKADQKPHSPRTHGDAGSPNEYTFETELRFFRPEGQDENAVTLKTGRHAIIHEFGHAVSRALYRTSEPKGYEDAIKLDRNEVGSYAKVNVSEDFAETVAMYILLKGGLNFDKGLAKKLQKESLRDYYFSMHDNPFSIRTKFKHRFAYLDKFFDDQIERTPDLEAILAIEKKKRRDFILYALFISATGISDVTIVASNHYDAIVEAISSGLEEFKEE